MKYMNIHIHICLYMYKHLHIQVCTYTHIYKYIHMYIESPSMDSSLPNSQSEASFDLEQLEAFPGSGSVRLGQRLKVAYLVYYLGHEGAKGPGVTRP